MVQWTADVYSHSVGGKYTIAPISQHVAVEFYRDTERLSTYPYAAMETISDNIFMNKWFPDRDLNKTFSDLRKQEQCIATMTENLTDIRCQCIQMFRSIYNTNNQIFWL